MGAMVFGGTARERIQFNEQTVWTGGPHDYAHKDAYKALPTLRSLLYQGRQREAEALATREFMSIPLTQKAYQALADLVLEFPEATAVTEYRRELDLERAVTTVSYRTPRGVVRREVFASHPAGVIVVRITGAEPFTVSLRSAHAASRVSASANALTLTGQPADSAIRFEARAVVHTEGGLGEGGWRARGGEGCSCGYHRAGCGHELPQLSRCVGRSGGAQCGHAEGRGCEDGRAATH